MAILLGIDCATSRLGSGLESCQAIEGLPNGVILVPTGWSLLKSSGTFDKSYVQSQIQLGNFVPLVGCFDLVSETPDPTTEESQSGIMQTVRQGKPMFTCTYKKGLAFQKIAYSYNSFGQYDALITYETGYIKVAETVDGLSIKGLTVGQLNTNGYNENNGTNSASTILKFQVIDPLEYNQYVNLLTNLDFNPNTEIFGITDCVLTGRADVSDDKIYVKVKWLHNEQYSITGLAAADFGVTIDGVDDAISGAITYNATTQEYAITPTATMTTSNAVITRLRDGSTDVAQLGNKFYRGTTTAITPVA